MVSCQTREGALRAGLERGECRVNRTEHKERKRNVQEETGT